MKNKILLTALLATLGSNVAFAEKFSRNLEAGVYGKATATYIESTEDFLYEDSHLNGYMAYHFNKKDQIKIDVGTRATYDEDGKLGYDLYADELHYKFTENKASSLVIGRFFNPLGLNGDSTYNYKDHPFTVRPNTVTSIDGLGISYLGELQKRVYFDLDVFFGTSLTDSRFNDYNIDLDSQFMYGANAEIAGAAGALNFGIFVSNNGDELEVNGAPITNANSVFYHSNISYEYSRNNLYFLVDYNHYEINFDEDIESSKDAVDVTLAYKVGSLIPMVGFSYENDDNIFQRLATEESIKTSTAKAGLRYAFNKNVSVLTEYNFIMPDVNDVEDEHVVSLGLTFNY